MTDLPLTLLRAFEAAARLGSLSGAARELNVTHAAIAQNVRKLEKELGQSLLVRSGAGMAPTPVGATLARDLGEGFGVLTRGVQTVRDLTEERPVTLSCTPTFAEYWLLPRLPTFWAAHPGIQVAITPSPSVVDLKRDGFDLAIRHGRGPWPGLVAEPLVDADALLVATPDHDFPERYGPMDDAKRAALSAMPWLLDESYGEYWRWVRALGIDLDAVHSRRFATNTLVIAATRAGLGVSVQPRAIVARDLDRGILIPIHESADDQGALSWLLTLDAPRRPALAAFLKWLRREARSTRASLGEDTL
ncbi:MAG: LysR family transcriptional regulator [Shimia sp.]